LILISRKSQHPVDAKRRCMCVKKYS
jgi:hypothetical protein